MNMITSKPILESPTQVRVLARLLFGHMNYRRLLSRASLAFVPVLWLVVAPTVYAEETVPASGTEATTLSPVSTRAADGNTFIGFTLAESWQGTFAGTRVGSGSVVIHPDGSIDAQSSGIFTGTIAGSSGTAVMRFHVSGTFAAATVRSVERCGDLLSGGSLQRAITFRWGSLPGIPHPPSLSPSVMGPTSLRISAFDSEPLTRATCRSIEAGVASRSCPVRLPAWVAAWPSFAVLRSHIGPRHHRLRRPRFGCSVGNCDPPE